MTYSTLIFASVFLPISILFLFFDRSAEYKNLMLCLTTFLFITWGKNALCALMFASIIIDWLLAIAVEGMLKKDKSRAAAFFGIDVVVNIFLFVVLARNELMPEGSKLHIENIYLPAGAAFYLLKNISYVYDVFAGRVKAERNPFYLLTYGMSYPFMFAGPVARYGDIAPQLKDRRLSADLLSRGIMSYAKGLAKTVIILPVLTAAAETALDGTERSSGGALIGMLAWLGAGWYGFTSLSDMSSGIACMNGFDVSLNYRPLNSKHLLGGLVKCYNTSMIELAEDMRGKGIAAAVLTVLLGVLSAGFYSFSKTALIIGAITGVILAAEYLVGYERIEKIPSVLKAPVLFIAALMLFSPLAFGSMTEWRSWLSALTDFGSFTNIGDPLMKFVKNNILILVFALAAASPLGTLVRSALDKHAARSPKAYTRVAIIRMICTAIVLALSYILLAAEAIK